MTVTYHVFQPFVRTEPHGFVVAVEPKEMPTASRAVASVRSLVAPYVAGIAFSRTGDPETGDWEDAVVLAQAGEVPIEFFAIDGK